MTTSPSSGHQDLHVFVDDYRIAHPDDVVVVEDAVPADQGVTALVTELRALGRSPMLLCRTVEGLGGPAGGRVPVLTNVFASRQRVAGLLGTSEAHLHAAFAEASARAIAPREVGGGPVLEVVEEGDVLDLASVPMLVHFAEDAGPYVTSAIVLAEDPESGTANLSYHRSMRVAGSRDELATSLHSHGHLWRTLAAAEATGRPLPVAVIIGGHPLLMLAAAARVGADVDERAIAGGLFGEPLEVVRTPCHGLGVPATADIVLEGVIDPTRRTPEGPFGEFSGYASHRSTNNVIQVQAVLRRERPMLLDVASGNTADHLNLGRIPRESELAVKLHERFPDLARLHYPVTGTHFHCYAAVHAGVPGLARQVLLAILGMDPYVKLAVAVDDDVDVTRDEEVLWALATRFQADRDVIVVPRMPGSLLDPSSDGGLTARMGLDATRDEGFEGERISLAPRALERARNILDRMR